MSHAWMPLYVADYLADTGHLSTLEHGAYMLLIMHYWQTGGLPDDERKLARIARLQQDQWQEIRDTLADLFGPGWEHKRIDAELAHASDVISKRSAAAKAMHAKRNANARNQQCTSDASASAFAEQVNVQTGSPSPSPSPVYSDADASDAGEAQPEVQPLIRPRLTPASMSPAPAIRSHADAFARFWRAYPHKVGKQDAEKAFISVMKRGAVPLDQMLAALDRYIRTKPPDRAWCNPGTWLRQGRWDDEPGTDTERNGDQKRQPTGSSERVSAVVDWVRESIGGRDSPEDPGGVRADPSTKGHGCGDGLPFGPASGSGFRR